MIRAGFSRKGDFIAPVFDISRHLRVVEAEDGRMKEQFDVVFNELIPSVVLLELKMHEIQVLVCGAVSRFMLWALESKGIHVIPFVSGEIDNVIKAWLEGNLLKGKFAMPGCKWRFRGMVQERRGQYGRGKGKGRAGGGGYGGRRGGQIGKNAPDYCVCPDCGYLEPHRRGIPCRNINCPKCGTLLIRK